MAGPWYNLAAAVVPAVDCMKTKHLAAYIPMDRRHAIARDCGLPDRAWGSALFADISGFTPLTEALVRSLGPRRGADELTSQLNRVYTAVIAKVHKYRGSVIGFSGDAITTWFDGDEGLRAVACGLAIEDAMGHFASVPIPSGETITLAMKAAVASGAARRFRVGEARIRHIDVLAGATLERVATAEGLADKGDVVVGPRVVAQVGAQLEVKAWRQPTGTSERFAVVSGLRPDSEVTPIPWTGAESEQLTEEQLRPWVLPSVFERVMAGQTQFLAELRPAVALFLRFRGLDYDGDDAAGEKLDSYIRWVQGVMDDFGGHVLQLTFGDKGSYLYAAFGAPIAHEDDAVRAVSAALEIQSPPEDIPIGHDVQIGLSTGRMRAGPYGSPSRRTYGVLGDEVNVAARLMAAAESSQMLVSQRIAEAVSQRFPLEHIGEITLKGKTSPMSVFSPARSGARPGPCSPGSGYAIPMVGREAELALLGEKLELALTGRGQIVGITGEAGIGKTRLAAELVRLAADRGAASYGSECESFGTNTSYLVWRSVWRALFGFDSAWSLLQQTAALADQLAEIDQTLVPRLPLLGALLNIAIPDNDLTRSFDAKLRKASLEALLVDCLRACCRAGQTLIVLEDCHWLDPLSRDLVEVLGRALADLPLLLALVYRPPEEQRSEPLPVVRLPHFTEVALSEFTEQEAEQLIALKLRQFAGPQAAVPTALVARVSARAEGNPFYIEELLNYLQDSGIDPQDTDAVMRLDLPTSLHSLILSRLDQRTETQRVTLRVASVIGRVFRAALLWGAYPEICVPERVRMDLDALCHHDLTQMDTPEPELTYLFRHIVTQEVAYESLAYATRATLHEQVASHIESTYARPGTRYVDLLAFHYGRSDNDGKKREYLRKAGEAAQGDYANETAIRYYRQLLPLLSAREQVDVMLRLGEVLQLVGRWDEAEELYGDAMALAECACDESVRPACDAAMGELHWRQGLYAEATEWLDAARHGYERSCNDAGLAQVLKVSGTVAAQQGDYESADARWRESLGVKQRLNDLAGQADLWSNLGIVAQYEGDFAGAEELYNEALTIRETLGNKWAIAVSLNNIGYLALHRELYQRARKSLDQAVALQREVGDRYYLGIALNNLGDAVRGLGDLDLAGTLYLEGLGINRDLGNVSAIAYLVEALGCLAVLQGEPERALRLSGAAAGLREAAGAPLAPTERDALDRMLGSAHEDLGSETASREMARGRGMSMEQAIEYALGHG